MSLFIQQDENRTELQKRLNTELQGRAKAKSLMADPDGVEDSAYLNGTKKTTTLSWAWILIVIAIIGIAAWLMALSIDYR